MLSVLKKHGVIIIGIVIALFAIGGIFCELVEKVKIANYPHVVGQVTSSVGCTHHSSRGGHRRGYRTIVGRTYKYIYRVDGRLYSGSQFISDSAIEELCFEENGVRVFYCADQPSNSFLKAKGIDRGFVSACLIFFTVSIFMLTGRLRKIYEFHFPTTTYWKYNVFDHGIGSVRSLGFIGHTGVMGEPEDVAMRAWMKLYAIGERFEVKVFRKTPNVLIMKKGETSIVLNLFYKRKLFSIVGVYCHLHYHGVAQCIEEFGEGRGTHDMCLDITKEAETHDENGYVEVTGDEYHQLHIGNAIFAVDVADGFLKGVSKDEFEPCEL